VGIKHSQPKPPPWDRFATILWNEDHVIEPGTFDLGTLADVPSGTVFYRKSPGDGPPEVQTLAVLAADLGSGGGNAVAVTLDFGASFTDKAQTVVTGEAWVAADSKIVAQVLTPAGVDPDELYLLKFQPVISNLVIGDGFTVTLYSEPEAKGTYTVNCIGV
jgi:hypothetical protein